MDFLHLLPLDSKGLLAIYALWGVSTTFCILAGMVKAVRVLCQMRTVRGKYMVLKECSVAGAFASLVAVAIFNWGTSGVGNEVLAMKYVILFYSFCEYRNGSICNIRSER